MSTWDSSQNSIYRHVHVKPRLQSPQASNTKGSRLLDSSCKKPAEELEKPSLNQHPCLNRPRRQKNIVHDKADKSRLVRALLEPGARKEEGVDTDQPGDEQFRAFWRLSLAKIFSKAMKSTFERFEVKDPTAKSERSPFHKFTPLTGTRSCFSGTECTKIDQGPGTV